MLYTTTFVVLVDYQVTSHTQSPKVQLHPQHENELQISSRHSLLLSVPLAPSTNLILPFTGDTNKGVRAEHEETTYDKQRAIALGLIPCMIRHQVPTNHSTGVEHNQFRDQELTLQVYCMKCTILLPECKLQ